MRPPISAPKRLPRVIFVDDEQRVLNSMHIMFTRQFEVFLAADGASALEIVKRNEIDVIVADHYMPRMTGVELLAEVRKLSPRTVRILLTDTADLDAIEGSINDSEVFRFLTKPCAPSELRAALALAIRAAWATPVPRPESARVVLIDPMEQLADDILTQDSPAEPRVDPAVEVDVFSRTMTEHELAATDVIEPRERAAIAPISDLKQRRASRPLPGNGVLVFSTDPNVVHSIADASQDRYPVYIASNIVQVVRILAERQPGVLVTDISPDRNTIQTMTSKLKQKLPELVTIVVSEHPDPQDMVWLINHGQIFRFLRKPVSPGRCAVSIQAALQHHSMLRSTPELVERHAVDRGDDTGAFSGVFEKLRSVRRLWA